MKILKASFLINFLLITVLGLRFSCLKWLCFTSFIHFFYSLLFGFLEKWRRKSSGNCCSLNSWEAYFRLVTTWLCIFLSSIVFILLKIRSFYVSFFFSTLCSRRRDSKHGLKYLMTNSISVSMIDNFFTSYYSKWILL